MRSASVLVFALCGCAGTIGPFVQDVRVEGYELVVDRCLITQSGSTLTVGSCTTERRRLPVMNQVEPSPTSPKPKPKPKPKLDREEVLEGIAMVRDEITGCNALHKTGGNVKLRITIDAAGGVSAVEPDSGGPQYLACVTTAFAAAQFAASEQGARFSFAVSVSGTTTLPPPTPPVLPPQPPPGSRSAPPEISRSRRNDLDDPRVVVAVDPKPLPQPRIEPGRAFGAVRDALVTCGVRHQVSGLVKISLAIGTDGRATSAVPDVGGPVFATCVKNEVAPIRFADSQRGSIVIPFQLPNPAPKAPPPPPVPPTPTVDETATKARQRASAMMKTAVGLARDGDCATVGKLGERVRTIDAEFHATVFVRDAEIARCLPKAAPPPPTRR